MDAFWAFLQMCLVYVGGGSVVLLAGYGAFSFAVKQYVEGAFKLGFDKKLEALKLENQRQLEAVKAEHQRANEALKGLQASVMAMMSQRHALADKRRIEAIDRIWAMTVEMVPVKNVADVMSRMDVEVVAQNIAMGGPHREAFEALIKPMTAEVMYVARDVRKEFVFVSPIAAAYCVAYTAICQFYFGLAAVIRAGSPKEVRSIKDEYIRNLIIVAIPEWKDRAEGLLDRRTFANVLDHIQGLLLEELKKSIEGSEIDESRLKQARAISEAATKAEESIAATEAAFEHHTITA